MCWKEKESGLNSVATVNGKKDTRHKRKGARREKGTSAEGGMSEKRRQSK